MDDEEMLFKQVQMTTSATKGTTLWVYRNTVYGYPWYTDVRKTLEDPAYAARLHTNTLFDLAVSEDLRMVLSP